MVDPVVETGKEPGMATALARAGNGVNRIFHPIAEKVCFGAMFLVLLMVAAVALDVILRSINVSLPAISEAVTYMMGFLTFLSLAYVGAIKGHISIDLFLEKFSTGKKGAMVAAHNIMGFILVSIFIWQFTAYAVRNMGLQGTLIQINLSYLMYVMIFGLILYLPIVVGEFLMALSDFFKDSSLVGWAIIILLPLIYFGAPIWFTWLGLSDMAAGIVGIIMMLLLLLTGIPMPYALGIVGMVLMAHLSSWEGVFAFTGRSLFTSVADYYRAVIPFFVMMGSLIATSGIGADLFNTMKIWAGRLPGSLAMASVATGAGFGAVCGDSFATAATVGKVALPEMKKAGYPTSLASGAVAAGGTLGIMIPPSNTFILYAIITEQSIAKLFMAGMLPGILITLLCCVAIYIVTVRNPNRDKMESNAYGFKEKLVSLKGVLAILLLFMICIGGIYAGFFTPVEGGAMGAFGTILFVFFRDIKGFKFKIVIDALLDAARIAGMILFILVGIEFINSGVGLSKIPMDLADAITTSGMPNWVVFGVFIAIFLAAGFILNIIVVLTLTIPIMLPTLEAMGVNMVWFGVIFVLVVMIGQLTPPIGVVCFLVKGLDKDIRLEDVFKGVTAMWMAMIVALILIISFPQIALFLVDIFT